MSVFTCMQRACAAVGHHSVLFLFVVWLGRACQALLFWRWIFWVYVLLLFFSWMPQWGHVGQILPGLKIALNCWEGVGRRSWFFSAVQLLHLQVQGLKVKVIAGPGGVGNSWWCSITTCIAQVFISRRERDTAFIPHQPPNIVLQVFVSNPA